MTRRNRTLATIVLAFLGLICVVALFLPARADNYNSSAACRNNLKEIQIAKRVWEDERGTSTNEVPTWTDLGPYIRKRENSRSWQNGVPKCPKGGTYTIGKLDELPKCSFGAYHSIQ